MFSVVNTPTEKSFLTTSTVVAMVTLYFRPEHLNASQIVSTTSDVGSRSSIPPSPPSPILMTEGPTVTMCDCGIRRWHLEL